MENYSSKGKLAIKAREHFYYIFISEVFHFPLWKAEQQEEERK